MAKNDPKWPKFGYFFLQNREKENQPQISFRPKVGPLEVKSTHFDEKTKFSVLGKYPGAVLVENRGILAVGRVEKPVFGHFQHPNRVFTLMLQ